MKTEELTLHLKTLLQQTCQHPHAMHVNHPTLLTQLSLFTSPIPPPQYITLLEEILCGYIKQKCQGDLPLNSIDHLLTCVSEVKENESMLISLSILLSRQKEGGDLLRKVRKRLCGYQVSIVVQCLIQLKEKGDIDERGAEALDDVCRFLGQIQYHGHNTTLWAIDYLIKNSLYRCLLAELGLTTGDQSIEALSTLKHTQPYLKSKETFDVLLQNIYLLSTESSIFQSLMEWICKVFRNKVIASYIAPGDYILVGLSQILLKVWELFPNPEQIKHFLRSLKSLHKTCPLSEKILTQILSLNNQKMIEENLIELIDFDIESLYPLVYSKMLPYALKSIDKVKQNIVLINYLVKIRLTSNHDWNILIKNQIFNKFFTHICHFLTHDNLVLLYRNIDKPDNRGLLETLTKRSLTVFPEFEEFLHYLLPEGISKEQEQDVLSMMSSVLSSALRKASLEQRGKAEIKYREKLWKLGQVQTSLSSQLKLVEFLGCFEKEEIDGEVLETLKKLRKLFRDSTELGSHAQQILHSFEMLPNKASALTLLSFCFFLTIEEANQKIQPQKSQAEDNQTVENQTKKDHTEKSHSSKRQITHILDSFLVKLNSQFYSRLHCYSRRAFQQVLYLISTEGINGDCLLTLHQIILLWINYASAREIHHIYEISRYESSSEFLQDRIKTIRALDESKDCRIFKIMDCRLVDFLQLFYKVVSFQHLQRTNSQPKCILYSPSKNRISLKYMLSESSLDRSFEVLMTLHNNPRNSEPVSLILKQPKTQHRFDIDDRVELFKSTSLDSRSLRESAIIKQETLIIKVSVDIENQSAAIEVNKQRFDIMMLRSQPLSIGANKNTHSIQLILETSDSYLQSLNIMYNSNKKLCFTMNTSCQTLKRFTLSIKEHFILETFHCFEFLSLKYLFVFILQIAKNELSYSLQSISSIFPLLYRIVFYLIEDPENNQFYGLFTFLQHVSKAIIQITEDVDFSEIREQTIRIMMKPNPVSFEYFKQIILNMDIWANCSFTIQLVILDITQVILERSQEANKFISEDMGCFSDVLELGTKFYQPSSPSKMLSQEEKQELIEKVNRVIFLMVTNTNEEMFQKCISQIVRNSVHCRGTRPRRRSVSEKRIPGCLIQDIVSHCLATPLNTKFKLPMAMLLFRLPEMRVIIENITAETNEKLFEYILKQSEMREQAPEVLSNLKILLISAPIPFLEKHFAKVLQFLEDPNKKNSQQQLLVNLLSPYMQKYPGFSNETKHKLLVYLYVFYHANLVPLDSKSTAFSVRFLAVPESVELLANLVQELSTDCDTKNKAIKLVDICFSMLPCMTKKVLFEFLFQFRRKAARRLRVLAVPIQCFDVSKRTITDCSLMVQYAFEGLQVYEIQKTKGEEGFEGVVSCLIRDIINHKYDQLYICEPAFESVTIDNEQLFGSVSKPFEIRGGIFFKLVMLITEYLRISEDREAVKMLSELLVINVDKSEELKNFRKSRGNMGVLTPDQHELQCLLNRVTKAQKDKDPTISIEVGCNLFQQQLVKQNPTHIYLEYTVLKLILLKHAIKKQEVLDSIDNLVLQMSRKYPHLIQQFDPEVASSLHAFDYSQFIKTLTERNNEIGSLYSSSTSPIKRTISQRNNTASPVKVARKLKTLFSIQETEHVESRSRFVKENAPVLAQKLLKVEFGYLYLIRNNIALAEDENLVKAEESKMSKEWSRHNEKLQETKAVKRNHMHLHWNEFLKKAEAEDGFLYERVNKKKPILKLSSKHLPNMVRGITKETTEYNYELMKTEAPHQSRKHQFLSYSFLKPKTSIQEDQRKSLVELIPTAIEEVEHSGGYNFDCEWITRRGVYFCSFSLNLDEETISIEADVTGRPNKPQFVYGSIKDSIIKDKSKARVIHFKEIKEVLIRRYNQIPNNALEIFTHNCSSYYLLLYRSKIIKRIFEKLGKYLRQDQLIISCENTFRERKYTQRWQSGKISNFDYLMALNTFSGRTFNDPCQYPIFPWIIKDYTSTELNLYKAETYRDLSLPVGALNLEKLQRYQENAKVQSEEEEYLYGSFMSTSMFVYFYLVRLEPFSSLARELQGGTFDSADRLFSSVEDVWRSVTCETNTSDVKELIPEFYSVNVFLENINRLNFGKTQSGEAVDDVTLPPWASDSNSFISMMRDALESDYVSAKLHLWIDLIFGNHQYSKQRFNQFHPRYYEENIHFNQVEESEIEALIAQITYFGQFPRKLFLKDHPCRIEPIRKSQIRRQVYTEDLKVGVMEKIKKVDDTFVLSIHQNKQSKSFVIKTPFDGKPKRIEVYKTTQKSGELMIVEAKSDLLYFRSPVSQVFLRKYNITIPHRRTVCSSRLIALLGRDLTLLNLQGQVLVSLSDTYPKACVILNNHVAFIDKRMCLQKFHILYPSILQTIFQGQTCFSHVQLCGYRNNGQQGYTMCFDRTQLVYLWL